MSSMHPQRRDFLKAMGLGAAAMAAGRQLNPLASAVAADDAAPLHVATNVYPWLTFYKRDNRDFNAELDAGLADIKKAGLDGVELFLGSPEVLENQAELLKKHGLQARSFYVGPPMHDERSEQSIASVLASAKKAKELLNTQIIVINAQPQKNKTDAMLRHQVAALEQLGRRLHEMGVTLSYHFHAVELENAAREFHHMLCNTEPQHLTLCYDAHWMFRGSGNSAVAALDAVKLYGSRISEVHLRQSVDGVWTEAFGEGDIDYPAMVKLLREAGANPLLVLEQAVEAQSPKTLDAVAAHRRGAEYTRRLFAQPVG